MMTTRYPVILVLLLTVAVLTGCRSTSAAGSDADQAAVRTSTVRVVDNAFDPPTAEVVAGDTVTWTWDGSGRHNVVGEAFESPVQDSGTFGRRFAEPGTYAYHCTLHSGMRGTITVVATGSTGREG